METMMDGYRLHHEKRTLPFGYWFETVWPSHSAKGINHDSEPILKDPPLNPQNMTYPVPAVFFENSQQEDFWTFAVRKMGPSILAQQSLYVGQSTTYDPDGVDIVISEHYIASQSLRNEKLLAIGVLASKGPEGRKAFDFGRKLYDNARQAVRNLGTQKQQRALRLEMDDILEQINYLQTVEKSFTQEERDSFVPTQVRFLQLATMAHAKHVHEHWIQELEDDSGLDENEHARHTLLIFNRGTRIFTRQLQALLENTQYSHYLYGLRQINTSLECAWMKLYYNPDTASCGTPEDNTEYRLINEIIDAFDANDALKLEQAIPELQRFPGVSWIHQSILHIIVGSLASRMKSLSQRFNEVKSSCDNLDTVRNEALDSVWHQCWKNFVLFWIDRGEKILVAIDQEAKNVEQQQAAVTKTHINR